MSLGKKEGDMVGTDGMSAGISDGMMDGISDGMTGGIPIVSLPSTRSTISSLSVGPKNELSPMGDSAGGRFGCSKGTGDTAGPIC